MDKEVLNTKMDFSKLWAYRYMNIPKYINAQRMLPPPSYISRITELYVLKENDIKATSWVKFHPPYYAVALTHQDVFDQDCIGYAKSSYIRDLDSYFAKNDPIVVFLRPEIIIREYLQVYNDIGKYTEDLECLKRCLKP